MSNIFDTLKGKRVTLKLKHGQKKSVTGEVITLVGIEDWVIIKEGENKTYHIPVHNIASF